MLTAPSCPAELPRATGPTPPADASGTCARWAVRPATAHIGAVQVRCARWAAEPTAATVPLIRSRVRTVLDGWRVSADIADVLLLAVSELTGNVVLHAPATSRMRVRIALRGGWFHLEVIDGAFSPARPLPHPRAEVEADAEGGRGLLIVGLLAAESGGELTFTSHEFGNSARVRIPAA
ncbi:ATP-binding protein [Streptomyces sp. NPDC087917]|uniref:ATP-binding protein n=1 Tax=Streptomyces sp. NPDC087917 TaxID=3155060 RepID=UPI00342F35F7